METIFAQIFVDAVVGRETHMIDVADFPHRFIEMVSDQRRPAIRFGEAPAE